MWNKKYAPALAILLAAGLTAGSLPVDVAAANAEQTEDVGAQEEKAKSTIEEGAGATGDSSKNKEELKSTDGGDTNTAETSKEDGKGSDKDEDTDQGDNSDAGTGTGKTEAKETGTGDAGTGEAGAGGSDENGSDNTTIVPSQEDGGEGAPVEESEEPFLVSYSVDDNETLNEDDSVTITITLNRNIRFCRIFQYRLYVDTDKFTYKNRSLDDKNFGRSMAITSLQTDKNTGKKYYAFAPGNVEQVLDTSKGASFSVTFTARQDGLENISQYFEGIQYGEFTKNAAYAVTLEADPTKTAVGDEVQVKTAIAKASSGIGREQYSAYEMTYLYDVEKLRPILDGFGDSYETESDAETGTLTIRWKGERTTIGDDTIAVPFKIIKAGTASVELTHAKIDDRNKLEDESYAGVDSEAPEAILPEAVKIKIGYHVTKQEGYTGNDKTEPGKDYKFTEPAGLDKEHYTYKVTVTSGGTEIEIKDNGDGTYSVPSDLITGELVINSTAVPKQYDVKVSGNGSGDVTLSTGNKATYLSEYNFEVKEDTDYTYTVTVKAEEKDVTLSEGEKAEDGTVTYTIAADKVTGNIEINVDKQVKTTAITFNGSGRDDVQGLDGEDETTKYIKTIPNNEDFAFAIDEKGGYLYTVKIGDEELTKGEDGNYKITKNRLTGTGITVMVDKAQKVDLDIAVAPYMKVNEKQIFRLTVRGTKDLLEGQTLAYGTTPMYWSEQYGAYTWLLCSEKPENEIKEDAKAQITQVEAPDTKPVITYDGDINGTSLIDVNDAQFVYGIYNMDFTMDIAKQEDMQKLLRADMNGDGMIDIKDAAAVIDKVMHPETADKK